MQREDPEHKAMSHSRCLTTAQIWIIALRNSTMKKEATGLSDTLISTQKSGQHNKAKDRNTSPTVICTPYFIFLCNPESDGAFSVCVGSRKQKQNSNVAESIWRHVT